MAKWLVKPTGEQLERLRTNVGLDFYTLEVKPEVGRVREFPDMDIYLFPFNAIVEDVVKDHMVRAKAAEFGWPEFVMRGKLALLKMGIPTKEVEIVEVQDE